jgi:hypothetical protein
MTRHGFPIPSDINPTDYTCVQIEIPNEQGHKMAFLGAIYALTRWYSWERDDNKSGIELAKVWNPIYEILEQTIDENYCKKRSLPMLRQNPDNACQQQYLDDTGNWVTFFDYSLCDAFSVNLDIQAVLNYSETNISNGLTAQELADYLANTSSWQKQADINALAVGNRNKLICYGLRIVFEVYLETARRNLEATRRGEVTLTMVVGAGLALAFAPLTPIVVGGIVAGFSLGGLAWAGTISEAELSDQVARDKVLCEAYKAIDNDVLSRATFSAMFDTNPFTAGTAEYKQAEALKDFCHVTQSYIAFVNQMMVNLASVDALVNECDDCISPTSWTHTFDFAVNNGDWYKYAPFNAGIYSGGAWVGTDQAIDTRYRRTVLLRRDMAETTVTSIAIWCEYTRGTFDQNISSYLIQSASGTGYAGTVLKSLSASATNDSTDYFEWSGVKSMRRVELQIASSHRFTASYSGQVRITKVVMTGTGTNPFI